MPTARRRPSPEPPRTFKADPRVLDRALQLARGDRTRLVVEPSGAIVVYNHPVREPPHPRKK